MLRPGWFTPSSHSFGMDKYYVRCPPFRPRLLSSKQLESGDSPVTEGDPGVMWRSLNGSSPSTPLSHRGRVGEAWQRWEEWSEPPCLTSTDAAVPVGSVPLPSSLPSAAPSVNWPCESMQNVKLKHAPSE